MSDAPAPTTGRMATRSCNADAHPGLIDSSMKRARGEKTKKQVAEERKKEKAQKKQNAIRRIGDVEKKIGDSQMIDATPGPRPLRRTKTFAQLPYTDDTNCDTGNNDPLPDATMDIDDPRPEDATDTDNSDDGPPMKKAKPAKASIRDSVHSYVMQERSEKVNNYRLGKHGTMVNTKGRQPGTTSSVHTSVKGNWNNEDMVSSGC